MNVKEEFKLVNVIDEIVIVVNNRNRFDNFIWVILNIRGFVYFDCEGLSNLNIVRLRGGGEGGVDWV